MIVQTLVLTIETKRLIELNIKFMRRRIKSGSALFIAITEAQKLFSSLEIIQKMFRIQ